MDFTEAPPKRPRSDEQHLSLRARLAVLALGARSVLQVAIRVPAIIYLTRVLEPAQFGIFALLQFTLTLLKLVGDGGLAAALLQQDAAPSQRQLSSAFWMQAALGIVMVGLTWVTAPLLQLALDLPEVGSSLLRVMALCFLFTLLRSVPILLMERQVKFGWVGTIEFVGSAINYLTSCTMATQGWGTESLVIGAVLETALMAVLAFVIVRWRPAWHFDWEDIRPLLGFGLAFQAIHVMRFTNQSVTPLLVGLTAGPAALGLVNFARSAAEVPTEVIGPVRRVAFPYLSRLQSTPTAFAREFDRAISISAIPTFFMLAVFFVAGPQIVTSVYGNKWLPAVIALQIFSMGLAINFYGWIAGAALEAIGQASVFLNINIVATVITWTCATIAALIDTRPETFAFALQIQIPVTTAWIHHIIRSQGYAIQPARAALPSVAGAGAIMGLGWLLPEGALASTTALIGFILGAAVLFLSVLLSLSPELRQQGVTSVRSRLGWL
ncbi:MAG: oligosaccharide flippase family protein [Myxococcales bacterium]|nr:oligosaccharide flippase family protein [Myxococcales bacterium]